MENPRGRDQGKALRVIPRGKQRLTVYRAHQVTRRAFLSSKSNTAAGEIELKHACQKLGKIVHKNEDCSKSVNSFHSGAIFQTRLGQELSRNAFGVSILSF